MRDRERKHLHHDRKGCHDRLINKTVFLCLELESKPIVVDKYTKT